MPLTEERHRVLYVLGCLAAFSFVVGCDRPPAKRTPARTIANAAVPDEPFATLSKGGCFGPCPVYTIRVFENGRVEYEGIRYIDPKGKLSWQIGSAGVRDVRAAFERASFQTLRDTVDVMTDVEVASIAFAANGVAEKTISYTPGSGGENRTRIVHLEAEFERTTGTWQHARAVDSDRPAPVASRDCGIPSAVREGRRHYLTGQVQVRYLVDGHGQASRVEAIGPADPRLFHEVSRWLTSCKFEPARSGDEPVPRFVQQVFRFKPAPVNGPGRAARR